MKAPAAAADETLTVEEEDLALYGDDDEVTDIKEPSAMSSASASAPSSGKGSSQWICLAFADGRFEVSWTQPLRVHTAVMPACVLTS